MSVPAVKREYGRYDKRFCRHPLIATLICKSTSLTSKHKKSRTIHPDCTAFWSYTLSCALVMPAAQLTIPFFYIGESLPLGDPCRFPCDAQL